MRMDARMIYLAAFISATLILPSHGFVTGAPRQACETLSPQHFQPPQSTPSPYSIKVSASQFRETGMLKVNLTGGSRLFRGFIIQARESATKAPIGGFDGETLPPGAQLGPCSNGGDYNSVTHKYGPPQTSEMIFSWKPPANITGLKRVYFQAAVVQDFSTYWVNILSEDFYLAGDKEEDNSSNSEDTTDSYFETLQHDIYDESYTDSSNDTTIPLMAGHGGHPDHSSERQAATDHNAATINFIFNFNYGSSKCNNSTSGLKALLSVLRGLNEAGL